MSKLTLRLRVVLITFLVKVEHFCLRKNTLSHTMQDILENGKAICPMHFLLSISYHQVIHDKDVH